MPRAALTNKKAKKEATKEKNMTKKIAVKKLIKESSPKTSLKAKSSPNEERNSKGSISKGGYYVITVRPKTPFVTFRTQEIVSGLQRVAGKRGDGTWETTTRMIHKSRARMDKENNLILTDKSLDPLYDYLQGGIKRIQEDIFKARPALNPPWIEPPVVETKKPKPAPISVKKDKSAKYKTTVKALTKPTKKAKILAAKKK